jgi:hypothetical protein
MNSAQMKNMDERCTQVAVGCRPIGGGGWWALAWVCTVQCAVESLPIGDMMQEPGRTAYGIQFRSRTYVSAHSN